MRTIISMAVVLALIGSGCIAPSVESRKEIFLISNPGCESDCTAGKITVNMTSGTSIEAEIEQETSPKTDIKLK